MQNLFLLQFRHELLKMFARRRTYIGFAAFLVVEILILLGTNLPGPKRMFQHAIEQNGFAFDRYFSGLTLGLQMVMWTVSLLGALFLALVAGDVVSKEVEEGTMRMMLCRPVSRSRIALLKYLCCVFYTFSLAFFIGLTALAAGVLYRGMGGLFVAAPMEHILALYEPGPGMLRYLASLGFLSCSLLTISSLGFVLSCFNMKPAAATVVTLTVMFLDFIFQKIPQFEDLAPYFISTHMGTWVRVFIHHVPWRDMAVDYAYLGALDATFVIVGVLAFNQRDFKA